MGFDVAFKRNQVEQAILAMLGGDNRDADAPDLRVRMNALTCVGSKYLRRCDPESP
jgi:hypothetical protein